MLKSKILIPLFLLLTLQLGTLSAGVVNIEEINEETKTSIMMGEQPNTAVKFTKGLQMPLNFYVMGDLVELDTPGNIQPLSVTFKETFYLRVTYAGVLISYDLNNWEEFSSAVDGSITLGVSANPTPYFFFGAFVDKK